MNNKNDLNKAVSTVNSVEMSKLSPSMASSEIKLQEQRTFVATFLFLS